MTKFFSTSITNSVIDAFSPTDIYTRPLPTAAEKNITDMQNIPLRRLDLSKEERQILKAFCFITLKPIIYMTNVNEDDAIVGHNKYTDMVSEYASKEDASVIVVCAKMESELAELNEDDKKEFLKEMGITSSGLDKLIYATYDLLGLQTFFTSGKDECRAWTFKKGMKAPECAGIIHSDFERGFIRAEVVSYDDLIACGSHAAAKEKGLIRLEGKEYVVKDGELKPFTLNMGALTPDEKEIILKGCLINYYRG